MLVYLLKVTLAWGLSLFLFEVLLRKNGYHGANRVYLLATLLAGFFLPLIEWPTHPSSQVAPVRQIAQNWTTIAAAAETTASGDSDGAFSGAINAATLALFIYACGVGIALSKTLREVSMLYKLRRSGHVADLPGNCVLHETGEAHGPFSFFNHIFISSREAYTPEELRMVLTHEARHARLLHSADMLLLQVLRIVLWFHPLIHWYAYRLRLTHEYEADRAAADDANDYGRFLVEQAILARAPSISHSFHSPIKTRIMMLTKNNRSATRILRYTLVLPLIAALLVIFSEPAYTDDRKQVGNKLYYRGNEFLMNESKVDTMYVEDAATGETKMIVTKLDPRPLSVNGERIYDGRDVVRGAVYAGKEESASAEYLERIKPILSKLPDGFYRLSIPSVIVGKDGKLIYHTGAEVWPCMNCKAQPGEPSKNGAEALMSSKTLKAEIQAAMGEELARGFRFTPAEIKGKPVNAYLEKDLSYGPNIVVVQNGSVRLREEVQSYPR